MEGPDLYPNDEQLALRVQEGDRDVFAVLVERYEKKLLRYGTKFLARREDIQDLVQEVFMGVYQNIQSFDASQKFSSWIYRIAHNTFVNGLKKNNRNPLVFLDFDTLFSHVAYEDPAQNEREQKEVRAMV